MAHVIIKIYWDFLRQTQHLRGHFEGHKKKKKIWNGADVLWELSLYSIVQSWQTKYNNVGWGEGRGARGEGRGGETKSIGVNIGMLCQDIAFSMVMMCQQF